MLATGPDGVTTIRAELSRPRVRLGTTWSPAPRFAVPYTFTLTREGTLIALALPRDVDRETRAVLTALTATAQLTDRPGASWTAVETDSLGSFEAHYRRDGNVLHKTKKAYRGADDALAIEVGRSSTTFMLGGDSWPAEIEQAEEIRVGFDKASVTVVGRVRMRWAGMRSGVVALAPANLEPVAIAGTSAVNRDAEDRELLDGATFVDLIATLGRVRDDGNTSAHTYLRLVALFRLDAEAAKQATSAVLAGTLDKRDNAAVIGALGEAGTKETQHLLAGLVENPTLAQEHRVHGTLALGLTAEPTRETLATLTATSRLADAELASTATLALGNAALRLRDQDAAAADRQVDELLARLRVAPLEARLPLLTALGNTGDARALDAIVAAMASPSELERSVAVQALRQMPGPEIDKLIDRAFTDLSSTVRLAAVFAVSERPLVGLLTRLRTVALADRDVGVRRAIVELAASRISEHAELRSLVERVAQVDPDPELRADALRFAKQT